MVLQTSVRTVSAEATASGPAAAEQKDQDMGDDEDDPTFDEIEKEHKDAMDKIKFHKAVAPSLLFSSKLRGCVR